MEDVYMYFCCTKIELYSICNKYVLGQIYSSFYLFLDVTFSYEQILWILKKCDP